MMRYWTCQNKEDEGVAFEYVEVVTPIALYHIQVAELLK